jgi:hypothetical protein
MEFPPTLQNFRAKIGNVPKTSFIRSYPGPFLLFRIGILHGDQSGLGLDTRKFAARKTTDSDPAGARRALDIFLSQVVKTGKNPHEGKITVGRGLNSDIVIPHPSVSKFHAYFQSESKGKVWKLWDHSASYGTEVQGIGIARGSFRVLHSGDVIHFAGSVQATFLSAPDFFDYMHLA